MLRSAGWSSVVELGSCGRLRLSDEPPGDRTEPSDRSGSASPPALQVLWFLSMYRRFLGTWLLLVLLLRWWWRVKLFTATVLCVWVWEYNVKVNLGTINLNI